MKTKRQRYTRNQAIRAYYEVRLDGPYLDLQNMTEEEKDCLFDAIYSVNTLDCIQCNTVQSCTKKHIPVIKETEEMNTTANETTNARRAIDSYIYIAKGEHVEKSHKACNMNPIHPSTVAQFIEWIEQKKYKLNPEINVKEPLGYWRDVLDAFNFQIKEPDYNKYSETCRKIEDDYNTIRFHNQVLEPEKVMKEAEDFKKKSYH